MVPLHEFLDFEDDERDGRFPYIWAVDGKNRLQRILCTREIVESCEERRQFWRQLKDIAGELEKVDVAALVAQTKAEMAQKLSSTLLSLAASGDVAMLAGGAIHANGDAHGRANAAGGRTPGAANGKSNGNGHDTFEPVWIETPECTACDECTEINPKIFAYNDDKKAVVVDPKAGPYKDIVKAAEKCTAGCIHPGTPFNLAEKDLERLVKRAEKFQ